MKFAKFCHFSPNFTTAYRFSHNKVRHKLIDKYSGFLDLVGEHGEGKINLDIYKKHFELTISNPSRKNAISGKMMLDLAVSIDQMYTVLENNNEIIGLIIKSTDDVFCSGADIILVKDILFTSEKGKAMSLFMTDALSHIFEGPLISIAAMNGPALGGGAELALACDLRVITADSYLQFVHGKLGITPGWGGGSRLVSLVGRRLAIELLGTSRRLSSNDALKLDIVEKIVNNSVELMHATSSVLLPYTQQPYPSAVRALKQVVVAATCYQANNSRYSSKELELFTQRWAGPDHYHALNIVRR